MTRIKLITENLLEDLVQAMEQASSIYFITSFVMESGVRLLEGRLKQAILRGAEVKILAGDYLFVTQPEGLRRLIDIDDSIEVRLWRSKGISFHPKAYLMHAENGEGLLIVGSSNLSRSALSYGVEWNLAMQAGAEPVTFDAALDQFMKAYLADQTIPVNRETLFHYEKEYEVYHQQHPELFRTWTEREAREIMFSGKADKEPTEIREMTSGYLSLTPRPAQKEALEELEKTLDEGYQSAMVVMATGLGKTYLAAFFAQRFHRVLFVAHREEILFQAQKSFQHVMPNRTVGIYNGSRKEGEADFVFASIYTLGMKQHRESFAPKAFDLIVIDEFHHAAAPTYQRILDYFEPSFLLGITATPDRMDGKDVYAICRGNVAYQLHFIEAIQRGWLSPFHYFGIYDETDYSQISWLGNRYAEEELLTVQLREDMAENIFSAWKKHKQTRTLGFCSSIRQANFLADYFQRKGVQALSLHSKTVEMSRGEALRRLEQGSLEIIFTVDLFNEGVDIPSVDTLLFTRPTESLTIFTQQIGRGLRLYEGKDHCTIIDLIGNYRNVDVKLGLFHTQTDSVVDKPSRQAFVEPVIPDSCHWEMDIQTINLLKELAKKKQPRKEKLREAYFELKQELGRRPTYLELHLHGNVDAKGYRQEFKSYPGFLYWAGELPEQQKEAFMRMEPWLREVESTGMAKSYKMVVLLYMLEKGVDHWMKPITAEEAAAFFHRYLTEKEYRKRIDFSDKKTKALWEYDKEDVANLIADMPMTKWSGSSKGLVSFKDGIFKFEFDIAPEDQELAYRWTKEICEYRLHEHFERKGRAH
ncbi:DEAD/DEAH box helicase family protein [Ammoniphilus sp. YIM 78166]|uniref:DEAD/DEAH box helicase family protein n=1 Tax=Ammoniphilus sp. YIM 78166 TaxID=1644106 RepID=UPI0010703B02|nr:DEAD/DEAH box helicase family protein [Ammoniphilus sp. YIM 78166]